MEAQAVVAQAPGQVEFKTVTVPEPTPEDVVVRVQYSWISPGTERSEIFGERMDGATPRESTHPLPFPHAPGYQKVGTVEWVGSAVRGIQVGTTVFASVSKIDGMYTSSAGHISPAVTHCSQVWEIPGGKAPVAYSGLVLTQVGYNCAMRPAVAPGDAVAIIGDGLIGHWAAQLLMHRGAHVMLIGKHDYRLAYFRSSKRDCIVNTTREDPLAIARSWAPQGLQAVIDTVGSMASLTAFLPLVRYDGHAVHAGFYTKGGSFDIQQLRYGELTLHSPSGWTRPRIDATCDLIARGVLETEPLITHRFPASQAVAAFDLVLSRREPFLGVVLDWE